MEIFRELLSHNRAPGRIEWIGIAESSRSPIVPKDTISIVHGGIEGDHHCRPARQSKRQVTLIQAEHLPVIACLLGKSSLDPSCLRRNIVVAGINLAALRYQIFRIGMAVLRGTGTCPPCSRMEENLGPGGYVAMLNHGGITATVESEGHVAIGDTVVALGPHLDEINS